MCRGRTGQGTTLTASKGTRSETSDPNWTRFLPVGLLAATYVAIAGALLFFGNLSHDVAAGVTQASDDAVLGFLADHQSAALDVAARGFSLMGSEVVALLFAVLLAVFGWTRRWGLLLALLAVTGGAQLLNNILKDHFQRVRPAPVFGAIPAQHWSFPSGHAMVAAAFYLLLAHLAWHTLAHRLPVGARLAWTASLVVLVVLIGWSRLYLGVHYLSDVIAGYAAGAAWTAAVVLASYILSRRPWRVEPRVKA